MEFQFDINAKFKEKVNEIPAADLRSQPLGRDVDGKAYWFLAVNNAFLLLTGYCNIQKSSLSLLVNINNISFRKIGISFWFIPDEEW